MLDDAPVTFTENEWAVMLKDPVYFGYAAPCGHSVRETDPFYIAEGCPKCFAAGESYDYETGECGYNPPPDFPRILCGHCKGYHIGTGAVRRCGLGDIGNPL